MNFGNMLFDELSFVIVDNTNIRESEIAPYVLPAEAFGYRVVIVNVTTDKTAPELAKTNVHGVPLEVLTKMKEAFDKTILPPWWKALTVTSDLDAQELDDQISKLFAQLHPRCSTEEPRP